MLTTGLIKESAMRPSFRPARNGAAQPRGTTGDPTGQSPRNFAGHRRLRREEIAMANTPRQPKTAPASKSGLKPGQGAPPPQDKRASDKRPVEEEDVFGGAERNHDARVTSKKTKP
jgi:hypothetical protein